MNVDVRYKLLLLLLVSIVAFSAKDLVFGSITFGIVVVMTSCMGQWRMALRFTVVYGIVIVAVALTSYLPPVLAGLLLMLTLCVRMFMPVLLYAKAFSATTTVSEMVTALYALKLPRSFVITFASALRFFPTAKEELSHISDALRLRGINLSIKNLFARPSLVFEGYMTPLMMRASTISEELSAASITRGIDNPAQRSSFYPLRITMSDTLFTIICIVALGAVFIAKMIA